MNKLRQEKIRFLLQKHGQLTVAELAEQFEVSEMTVRRDLKELAAKGLVQREHGKAVFPQDDKNIIDPKTWLGIAHQEKTAIGKIAASLVKEGETVILDSGTTTMAVAIALTRRCFVITNSLRVANVLGTQHEITTILTGGEVQKNTLALMGPMVRESLDGFNADKLFLCATGISVDKGLSTTSMAESEVKQAMLNTAKEVILVAHSEKIGLIFHHSFAKWEKINKFITDAKADSDLIAKIQKNGVEVILAD